MRRISNSSSWTLLAAHSPIFRCFSIDYTKDYYKTLGINKNASEKDIKMAFYKLAKKYHPDIHKGSPETFKQINEAYEVLGDTQKRKDYDSMQGGASSGPFSGASNPFGARNPFNSQSNPYSSQNQRTGNPSGYQSQNPFSGYSNSRNSGYRSTEDGTHYYYEQYQNKENRRWNPNAQQQQRRSDYVDEETFKQFFQKMSSTFEKMKQEAEKVNQQNTKPNNGNNKTNVPPWQGGFGWDADFEKNSRPKPNYSKNDQYYSEYNRKYYEAKEAEQQRRMRENEIIDKKAKEFIVGLEDKIKNLKNTFGSVNNKNATFTEMIKVSIFKNLK